MTKKFKTPLLLRRKFHWREKWKDVKGYEGRYLVSNRGRVKKLDDSHKPTGSDYRRVPWKMVRAYFITEHVSPYIKLSHKENGKLVQKLVNLKKLVAENWLRNYDPNKPVDFRNPKHPWDCSIMNIVQGKPRSRGTTLLTDEIVREIKKELAEHGHKRGYKAYLTRKYDIHRATLWKINKEINWKHVQIEPEKDIL